MKHVIVILICIIFGLAIGICKDIPRTQTFCIGEMYETIQNVSSENLIDKKLTVEPEIALGKFKEIERNQYYEESVEDFVEKYFEDEHENDFDAWKLSDEGIRNVSKSISERNLAYFVNYLTNLLFDAAIQPSENTINNIRKFSLLTEHGFIKRHKEATEMHYWESYWIVKGLLLNNMFVTAKEILNTFISMVKEFGFIPKSNRMYYIQRSAPPVLTLMAYDYFFKSQDVKWLKSNVEYLDIELMFWVKNRAVYFENLNTTYQMFRYNCNSTSPRPEAYKYDEALAEFVRDKETFYKEINSASESGWGICSRWLDEQDAKDGWDFTDMNVTRIIPVDLNAYLHKNFVYISRIYSILSNTTGRKYWYEKSKELEIAIREILWNEEEGIWFDYDLKLKRNRKTYFISNFTPLWAQAYHYNLSKEYTEGVIRYINKTISSDYKGCLPDSLSETFEEFDFPNSHTYLMVTLIQGLKYTQRPEARQIANVYLMKWMDSVMTGFAETNTIFDSYSAVEVGQHVTFEEWNEDFTVTVGTFLDVLDSYFEINERTMIDSAIRQVRTLPLLFILISICMLTY